MAKTLQLNEPEKTIRVRMPIWMSEQIKLRASRRGISRHQLVSKWLSERRLQRANRIVHLER